MMGFCKYYISFHLIFLSQLSVFLFQLQPPLKLKYYIPFNYWVEMQWSCTTIEGYFICFISIMEYVQQEMSYSN